MKGFKEFIMRGNVVELAVAVIIGAAFTTIVNAIVEGIFNPMIAAIFSADDIQKAVLQLGPVTLGVGAVLGAIINFLLVALVVYFVIVLPVNKFNRAAYIREHGHEPDDGPAPSETDLLAEIRDLLAAREGDAPQQGSHGVHGQ